MARELTGRKVFLITASAFGVIIAVNVGMAVQAVRTFPGLEVDNSYVASQTFDADRKAQEALGWTLSQTYRDGRLTLAITDADRQPVILRNLSAIIGRTTEAADDVTPAFTLTDGTYTASVDLAPGRWLVRLEAHAPDGTLYRKRLDIFVKG